MVIRTIRAFKVIKVIMVLGLLMVKDAKELPRLWWWINVLRVQSGGGERERARGRDIATETTKI
jgi:hypothetical protein